MSAILEKLYPAVKKDGEEKIVANKPATSAKSKKSDDIYPPVSGEDLTIGYIKDKKPPKKVIIEYLRNRIEELAEDSD